MFLKRFKNFSLNFMKKRDKKLTFIEYIMMHNAGLPYSRIAYNNKFKGVVFAVKFIHFI